jgi:2-polyprenyl-6-methoxyphenol hydroxylase-like FAD-dependent oxidoreductase
VNPEIDRPVLVAGAGPTGLAAALELTRLGRPVRIIDRKAARSQHSKAIGVNPRTLELLEAAGVTERLLAAGRRIRKVNLRRGDRLLAAVDLTRLEHRYNFMLALAQSETERILEVSLAERGVRVEWQTELKAFAPAADRIRATIAREADEQEVEAGYLIGADGAHSTARHALGVEFRGDTYPFEWQVVDVRMSGPFAEDEVHLRLGDTALLFLISAAPGTFRLASDGADPLQLLPRGCAIHEIIWRSSFWISYRQVDSYQQGRVFLAGDAAHIHSPVGGRGMNLGIEDATIVARKLAGGGLDTYTAERHPVGARVIRQTHALTRLVTARAWWARSLREHLLPLMLGLEPAQRQFRLRLAGLR